MSAELFSILALAAMFVVATLLPINMGLLAFATAFLVGTLAGDLTTDEILGEFPGQIFLVLVGITYLFGIAKANGTIDWLIRLAVRAVRGHLAAIPWVMFGVAATLTAIGAVSPAAVAIVAPIALGFAAQYKINPLLMGALVVHGAQAGGFSPISVYGSIVNGVVADNGLPQDEAFVFFASLVVNLLIAGVVFIAFGGLRLLRTQAAGAPAGTVAGSVAAAGPSATPATVGGRPRIAGGSPEADGIAPAPAAERLTLPTPYQALTLLGLVALVVCTLAFDLDVGFVAVTVAVALALFSQTAAKEAAGQITWSVVLLICGVLTYVGVLEQIGTIDYVGNAVADVGAPLIAALLLCYIGAIVSAFASSVGVLGATIPLAVPFLLAGDVGAVGFVAALSIASTVVDVSPFSTNGALVLANARNVDREAFFRKLLAYGAVITLVAPLVVWLPFVVLGIG
jgi:di/tricarboxylate transporter